MKITSRFLVLITSIFIGSDSSHAQWVQSGLNGSAISALRFAPNAIGGMNLFAGTNGNGVYRSTDNGANWAQVDSGLTLSLINYCAFAASLNGSGTNIFVGCSRGVYLSTNNGTSWTS